MTPGDILKKCHSLNVAKTREMGDDYAEIVFFRKDLDKWSRILSESLGACGKKRELHAVQGAAKAWSGGWEASGATRLCSPGKAPTEPWVALYWPWPRQNPRHPEAGDHPLNAARNVLPLQSALQKIPSDDYRLPLPVVVFQRLWQKKS